MRTIGAVTTVGARAAPAGVPTSPLPSGPAADLLGLTWQLHADPYALGLAPLIGLAVRDNAKRAQLVVSRVLAKHIPAAPSIVRGAALLLAGQVARTLGSGGEPGLTAGVLDPASAADVRRLVAQGLGVEALVVGYCETATGLGHGVADALGDADYLHTTRRHVPGRLPVAGFDEEHSHAVRHQLLPGDPGMLSRDRPLVLVDDELTTGTTSLNTIAALQARWPRDRYVLAVLADLRPPADRRAFDERAAALGVRVDVASLVDATLLAPADVLERAVRARSVLGALPAAPVPCGAARVVACERAWPSGIPLGGRQGFCPSDRGPHAAAVADAAAAVAGLLPDGGRVLVVGTEELMHTPVLLADELDRSRGGGTGGAGDTGGTVVQSTTRSPVVVADRPGYAVRRLVAAPAPDEPHRLTRLHNLIDPHADLPGGTASAASPAPPYAGIVLVTDTPAAAAIPLARELARWASDVVVVAALAEAPPEPA